MKHLSLLITLLALSSTLLSQRIQQPLGRGVVAVQSGSNVTVTWRRLAQEPENAQWNVYLCKSGNTFTKLNGTPLKVTNYRTTTSQIPVGAKVAVSRVVDGVEGEMSLPFLFQQQSLRNIYMEISYQGGPLNNADYTTKFVWPVDLDGNGEYDYVVDRNSVNGGSTCIEAYLADGTYLWTVDMGPNELVSAGQDDQVCAYDIDCDGYGEVLMQTSDGTRFWDKANHTWGLYVNGSTTADTDGDGIVDYNQQSTRNAPKYMTVVDGMTGAEKVSVEQWYDDAYNRTNKSALMGDEYNRHVGHVGIFYPDGMRPALVMEWHTRTTGGAHQYRNSAWAFDFDAEGHASQWHQLFMQPTGGQTFHQIRIFDADGDGCDELSSGAYCMDQDGTTLYNTGISHGDRHRTADIDPERPGLETFSIQQNAPDMLGQILFDAATGEAIKKWYLPAVGDVGRGECMDLDPNHLGWEMFSTMNNYQMYDAKGDEIPGMMGYFPTEGIWWDGDLGRERVDSPDGNGYNADIRDYTNGRLIEMAKESNYTIKSSNAKRGKFWGDIIGDWREELILNREVNGVNTGIVGFSTDIATAVNNIYCLQEDPHYRGDCTTRGYYQSPDPGFYLGYDMPRPPLPPCMRADADNEVYGLALGNTAVTLPVGKQNIYAMPVKGQTLTLEGNLSGPTELWKSQQGTAILKGTNQSSGRTIISEGTLQVDGRVAGTVELRARGTLSGRGEVGNIVFEKALNYEGCRLMPTDTLTIADNLSIDKECYIELNLDKHSLLSVKGDLSITATTHFTILSSTIQEGLYPLIQYTGQFAGALEKCQVRGLKGINYDLLNQEGQILLRIYGQRSATNGVVWNGNQSEVWDYKQLNWRKANEAIAFVANDSVLFDDDAFETNVRIPELMPIGRVEVEALRNFTFWGEGGLSGSGALIKNGTGQLTLNCDKSDYTGATIIHQGTVKVQNLADGGVASSIGAASADAANLQIDKATLLVNNASASTNRGMTLNDTATLQIPSGTTALKGLIRGNGILRKTGSGQLNITYAGNNSWLGTILQAGTLAMGCWNTTFGKSGSTIHVTGNSTIVMFDVNSTSTIPNFGNVLEIDSAMTCTFKAGSRCTVKGSLKGKGTYKISFPYVRGDVSTNCSAFQGIYQVTTANCRFVQAMDLSKAVLQLDKDAYASGMKAGSGTASSYTHKVGSLTGSGTIGSSVWNVGYRDEDFTFGGVVESGATLNKYGTGTMTLTGEAVGPVHVYSGSLASTDKKSASISNLTIHAGAVLSVGYSSAGTVCDQIKASRVTMTSPVLRVESRDGTSLAPGSVLQIFPSSASVSLTGALTIEPATPCEGGVWDTSTFGQDGCLRITVVDGIETININDDEDVDVYDLQGRKLKHPQGIHVRNGKLVR